MVYSVNHCLFIKLKIWKMSFPRDNRHLSVEIWTKIFHCILHFPMVYTTCMPSFTAMRTIKRMLRVFKQGNINYNHPVFLMLFHLYFYLEFFMNTTHWEKWHFQIWVNRCFHFDSKLFVSNVTTQCFHFWNTRPTQFQAKLLFIV